MQRNCPFTHTPPDAQVQIHIKNRDQSPAVQFGEHQSKDKEETLLER